jgi:hypothetical protein
MGSSNRSHVSQTLHLVLEMLPHYASLGDRTFSKRKCGINKHRMAQACWRLCATPTAYTVVCHSLQQTSINLKQAFCLSVFGSKTEISTVLRLFFLILTFFVKSVKTGVESVTFSASNSRTRKLFFLPFFSLKKKGRKKVTLSKKKEKKKACFLLFLIL